MRNSLCSIYKASEAFLGFYVGCPVQTHQEHVPSKGSAGALRQICFSCFSNASSSEAMLLFKPLKELRAKRKGTHLVDLHAFSATFYPCVVLMRINLTGKDERLKLFIFALLSVQYAFFFFAVFCVR